MKKTLTTTLLAILVCVCMVFGFTACGIFNDKCEHTYDNACDTTCNKCEETRTITHAWVAADCDTPKTCKICGNTEGEELGHDWEDADCVTPKTCSVCGATEGEELGHTPKADDGDCTTAITCKDCGEVTTEAKAAHTPEDDDGDCTTAVNCTVCEQVAVEAKSHTPEADDGNCTTAVKCANCEQDAVASYTAHSTTDTDADWMCDNLGCEQLIPVTLDGMIFELNEDGESCYVKGLVYGFNGTEVIIPATVNGKPVTAIGMSAFADSGLTSVTIPASVKTIGEQAFYYCSRLTSVVIPASVTTIGEKAFAWCRKLQSVVIPASVTAIGEYAFFFTALTSVTIPASVTTIGSNAFLGCNDLTSVYYGGTEADWGNKDNITIGDNAIPSNTTVYYYSSDMPTAEGDYWRYVDGVPTVWPAGSGTDTPTTVEADGLVFTLNEDGESYSVTDLITYFAGTEVTIPATVNGKPVTAIGDFAFAVCNSLTSVTIPDSVTTIGKGAFSNCSALASVTFGANSQLKTIYVDAFACTGLTSVTIPASVTEISTEAFYGCESLERVTFGEGSELKRIGGYAFYGCIQLKSVTFGEGSQLTTIGNYAFYGCSALTSVTIPASVTEIGGWAFQDCSSLTSVTIPGSVTTISRSAFQNCTALTSVYYGGTEADWGDEDKITIGGEAIPTNATVYYYSENKPEGEGNYWHYAADGVPTTKWDD